MPDPTEQLQIAMTLVDSLGTIIEATVGYRQKLVAAGFSESASELMAVDLHRTLLAKAFS